ncbi:MAG: purine-nucleoside phosphorylase [Bryobacteraceae bacterium]
MKPFAGAADYVALRTTMRPRIGVVLGSGLGAFADTLGDAAAFPYHEIPGWPQSTAVGHAGRLVVGLHRGAPLAVMSGRAHLYEGHSIDKVVFGVRALAALGVRSIIFTNAAGGINLRYSQGALVLVSDHINLQGVNPLSGPNDDELGPRFPDMSDAYDPALRAIAHRAAASIGIQLNEGVYAGLLGPSYETPAEIRYLRAIGADLVGMSTVPEVIAARHMGVRCLAISCVTNMAAGVLPQKIHHGEVLETGARVRDTLVELIGRIVAEMAA